MNSMALGDLSIFRQCVHRFVAKAGNNGRQALTERNTSVLRLHQYDVDV